MAERISLDESFDDFSRIEEPFQEYLDESLDPRGPESLFGVVASLRFPRNPVAVDVGCGEGDDAIQLAKRFGFRVHGVDRVRRQVERAAAEAKRERIADVVDFHVGVAEQLPVADSSADLVWCKEVLMFADLDQSLSEFARVMRPDGVGLVFQFFTGRRMTDEEAHEFWGGDLGYGDARNVQPSDLEAAIAGAGLMVRERIDFGSEWGEYGQERRGAGGRRLLHAARLLRDPARYVDRYGDVNYRIMLGDCLWHVYRMIGKLDGVAFVFGHGQRSAET